MSVISSLFPVSLCLLTEVDRALVALPDFKSGVLFNQPAGGFDSHALPPFI